MWIDPFEMLNIGTKIQHNKAKNAIISQVHVALIKVEK